VENRAMPEGQRVAFLLENRDWKECRHTAGLIGIAHPYKSPHLRGHRDGPARGGNNDTPDR
jgi:hypothetical protein